MVDYTIDKVNAEQDAWTFPATLTDPVTYASEWASRVTAKYFGQPVLEELLALIYSRVSSKAYSKLWTCVAGLNVGDPVYISATDTVTLALATTEAASKVIGFVRYKPTTETCYIEHFVFKTGLAGLTAGNAVYLTDAGGFGATAGTVAKRIGTALDTDEAIVYAASVSGISELIEDVSPTLGGDLDANAKNITNVAKLLIGATAFDSAASLQETVSDTYAIQRILSASATATYGSYLYLQRARGTQAARTSPLDGDDLGAVYGVGHTGAAWGVSGLVSVLADGNHGADSTPGKLGLWTTPSGAVAGVLRVLVDKDGNVGISEATPGTLLDMAGTAPYFTLHNTTEEDGDGGRESKLIFEGEQSGGELTTLGEIEFSHDGASDDQKGKFTLRLNDGSDGTSPTTVMTALSSGNVGIGCTPAVKFNVLGNGLFNTADGNLDDDVVLIHGQPRVAVVENTFSTADNLWLLAIGNNTSGAVLNFAKTRSNSTDAVTIVQNNDVLMQINGMGADGAGRYRSAAAIRIEVDGTPDSADMPGRIVLATTADGAASVTDRVFVSSSGNVGIGAATPASIFEVQDGLTTTGAVVTLSSKETSTVDGDVLGRINFRAALDAAGSDAILAGASIWAEADDTFSATNNSTELCFGTATTSVAIERMRIESAGNFTFTQGIQTTGSPTFATWTGAAHTTLTASVEATDVLFDLSRIVEFSTGALATQRAFVIENPTYAFVAASTITTAATFAILGAPVAGANATITNALSFWVQAGNSQFEGDARIPSDTFALKLGAGLDMSVYYNGTNGMINTSLVAASDLTLTCGAQKTLVLTNTVYNDANVGGATLRNGATNPPVTQIVDNVGANTGIYTLGFAINDEASGCIEIPHDYKEGTDLVFHIHWFGNAVPAGGTDNVKWQVTYSVCRDGVTTPPATTPAGTEVAYTTQYSHVRTDLATISGASFQIGDQVQFNIKRIAASADDYAGVALLDTVGFHYQCDTLGSRQIAVK